MMGRTLTTNEKPVSAREPEDETRTDIGKAHQRSRQRIHAVEERAAHGRLQQQDGESELDTQPPEDDAPRDLAAITR